MAICLLFENYMLERLFAKTLASNAPALRSMQRSGMQHCGNWRAYATRGGQRIDAHIYDITRARWLDQPWRSAVERGSHYA